MLPRARWDQPDEGGNGLAFYAAHLLDLVAWSRRGYAPLAADVGAVSFYEGPSDSVAPRAPTGVSCTPGSGGAARVDWSQVTQDVGGGNETVTQYRVYWGTTARPGSATRPGEAGFDYDHTQSTSSIYLNLSSLNEGATYYVAVIAVDAAQNASIYSAEVSCAIPVTPHAPVADLTCTPTSGDAPLDVSCDATGSTDPNGAGDIATYFYSLDGAAEAEEADGIRSFTALAAGNHNIQVRVVDQGGLDDTATQQITVTDPGSQNHAPTASFTATPTSGLTPLQVSLDASSSTDPDGDNLSYSWSFGDSSADGSGATTSHTYSSAGGFTVTLTVTDDGTPPLSGTSTARITATTDTNQAPVLDSASVSPLYGPSPLTVRFDASGVYDPDSDNLTLSWDFGDSSAPSSQLQLDHVYTGNGQYQAVLTVEDDGTPALGPQSRSFTISVTDNNPPDASAALVGPQSGPAPLRVALDATGCGDPDGDNLTYFWDIALDIVTSETFDTASAAYTFDQPGSYEITLTLTDDGSPPLEVTRRFQVEVQAGVSAPKNTIVLSQGCACAQGAGSTDALVVLALALGVLGYRRRPRGTRPR
ncbi:MAG: PKD domain-containing protein [Pseudomonadota bacterium]